MLGTVLESALWVLALLALTPCAVVFLECLAAVVLPEWVKPRPKGPAPRVCVLIPAHDEAGGIESAVSLALRGLGTEGRVLVVADNCTDDTAERALRAGAEVVERTDPGRRGKGFALAAGIEALRRSPPEAVLVLDADVTDCGGSIEDLAREALALRRPVQALYRLMPPPEPSLRDRISSLAVTVRNVARPSGLRRLGLPCHLTGCGMLFPWSAIEAAPLASGEVVEDLKLGIDLALRGAAPLSSAALSVGSVLPADHAAATSQRRRWEHGHLAMAFVRVPSLIAASFCERRPGLLVLGLDLSVPPVSLLVVLLGFLSVAAAFLASAGGGAGPAVILGAAWIALAAGIGLAWFAFARAEFPLRAALAVPLYVMRKVPLYLRFLIAPQRLWIRTPRETRR